MIRVYREEDGLVCQDADEVVDGFVCFVRQGYYVIDCVVYHTENESVYNIEVYRHKEDYGLVFGFDSFGFEGSTKEHMVLNYDRIESYCCCTSNEAHDLVSALNQRLNQF